MRTVAGASPARSPFRGRGGGRVAPGTERHAKLATTASTIPR